MNNNDPNIPLLEDVAAKLGGLREQTVLVGGCAVGLLITDAARPPVRATTDVDLVIEIATRGEYYEFSERLRERGFKEVVGDVMCRWRHGILIVDVMPTKQEILGFSNQWYAAAVQSPMRATLPSGNDLWVVIPPLFVATKIEAFHGRGNNNFAESHDIEDIVNLVDGRKELVDEIIHSNSTLRDYLRSEMDDFLADGLTDSLPWHFAPDAANQARIPIVIERLRAIAGL
jgi:predicted nucleotidyltransferase